MRNSEHSNFAENCLTDFIKIYPLLIFLVSGLWAVMKRSVISPPSDNEWISWVQDEQLGFPPWKDGEGERRSDLALRVNLWGSPSGKSTEVSQSCSHRSPLSSECTACWCASVSSLLQHHHSSIWICISSVRPLHKVIICSFKCSVIIS